MSEITNQTIAPQLKLSNQMRAVLTIFASNRFLKEAVLKFVDIANDRIDWDQIFLAAKCSGYNGAAVFAYGIWTDNVWANSNPFEETLGLDREIQEACLRALALRWGLKVS